MGFRHIVWCAIALASAGCATKHDGSFAAVVNPGEAVRAKNAVPAPPPPEQHGQSQTGAPRAKATPKSSVQLSTIEGQDPALASALVRLTLSESAENHRLVADAYRNAGVTDYAHRHYEEALRLAPCNDAALEGLAQVSRDWRMPNMALGDAYRALWCRPDSAAAQNTLGTVFQSLGQTQSARRAFERAVELDAHAAYALNNLCYLELEEGDARSAQPLCVRALAEDPTMTPARTNLALAYVMQGDVPDAEGALLADPDPVAGWFSVGMLRMSLGRYEGAADAFQKVAAERPEWWKARRRALQARARAVTEREP